MPRGPINYPYLSISQRHSFRTPKSHLFAPQCACSLLYANISRFYFSNYWLTFYSYISSRLPQFFQPCFNSNIIKLQPSSRFQDASQHFQPSSVFCSTWNSSCSSKNRNRVSVCLYDLHLKQLITSFTFLAFRSYRPLRTLFCSA